MLVIRLLRMTRAPSSADDADGERRRQGSLVKSHVVQGFRRVFVRGGSLVSLFKRCYE